MLKYNNHGGASFSLGDDSGDTVLFEFHQVGVVGSLKEASALQKTPFLGTKLLHYRDRYGFEYQKPTPSGGRGKTRR